MGKAQLAFEVYDAHEQKITIQTLIGPSVHDDSYGTLHIGPSQFAQILQIGNYLPFNLHLYNGGTIVLPSAVTFQSSKNVINGILGGAVDMAVIDAEVSFGKGAASLPDAIPRKIVLEALHVEYDGTISCGEGVEQFTIEAGSVDLSPGSSLLGQSLHLDVDSLSLAETAILSVDNGGTELTSEGTNFPTCVQFYMMLYRYILY